MAFKFVFALAFVAVASAGYAPAAPLAVGHNVLVKASEDYDPHPQYKFTYGVDDRVTGDSKSQVEVRDGDVVRGEYSLIDADGYKRTVHYTADDVNGFNAVVEREPLTKSVAVAPVISHASPQVAHYTAPSVVQSVAPVTHYSAPVAHSAGPAIVSSYAVPVAHHAAHHAPASHYASYSGPAISYHH